GNGAHGLDEILGRCVLEHETGGSLAQGLEDVVVPFECGQDDDTCVREGGNDLTGRRQPVPPRHLDVHQDYIGTLPGRHPDGLGPIRRLADDVDVVDALEDQPEPGPDHVLVVGQHDPDHDVSA